MPTANKEFWPELPWPAWKDTQATLHLMTQIVGKIRTALSPWINHSWGTTLYVTARGLSTSSIATTTHTFQIDFDFLDHALKLSCSDGRTRWLGLTPRPVADFYCDLMATLDELGIQVRIHGSPNEIPQAIPFAEDRVHDAYDAAYVERYFRIFLQVDRIFKQFRSRYVGKCSPVHFFWGSFDLAVTRFSGQPAPAHPGGAPNCPNWVMQEAYSQEVSSCGFWPGNEALPYPAFYSYAYPQPPGYEKAAIKPAAAHFDSAMGEFILPYDAIRTSSDPDRDLLDFLQSSYEAAANAGKWKRAELERSTASPPPWPG